MRVFVPYCPVDGDDEVTIKCSIDGTAWEETEPIFQPGLLKDLKVCSCYHEVFKMVILVQVSCVW